MTTKAKKPSEKKRDPLPEHFASLEEAAEFWNTHDSADYEEYFVEVDVEVDLKRTISVDSALYDRVSAIAKKKHTRTNELLSRWIKEKLRDAA